MFPLRCPLIWIRRMFDIERYIGLLFNYLIYTKCYKYKYLRTMYVRNALTKSHFTASLLAGFSFLCRIPLKNEKRTFTTQHPIYTISYMCNLWEIVMRKRERISPSRRTFETVAWFSRKNGKNFHRGKSKRKNGVFFFIFRMLKKPKIFDYLFKFCG